MTSRMSVDQDAASNLALRLNGHGVTLAVFSICEVCATSQLPAVESTAPTALYPKSVHSSARG
jgi:hypothetical protein